MYQQCRICGTINYLYNHHAGARAWDCYYCQAKHWIDEACKEEYMIENSCLEDQAEIDLQTNFDNIIFLNGTYNG